MAKKRASEESFNELHLLLTNELVARIKTGEATTADLRAAIDWLHKNDITGVPVAGSPLASLAGLIPELTFDDVQEVL
jgi:dienelactone hydrolase